MSTTPHFPTFTPTSGALVRSCAARWGDRTFVVLDDERLTYAEADERSARLAKGLLVSGVGKGSHVGLLAPNGPAWVVAWLAATRIGAVVAMLNTYSKAEALGRAVRHADLGLVLTAGSHLGHDYLDRLEEAAPGLAGQRHEHLLLASHPYLRSVWTWGAPTRGWCGDVAELHERGGGVDDSLLEEVEREVRPSDPMVIVYSSGSTAEPKGAIHGHGATVRHAHNLGRMRDLRSDDVIYTPMPLFWVGGFSFTLVAAMHAGATLVFEEQFEPGATLALLERERVTQVLGWPHMAKALVDHPTYPDRDLSAVRAGSLNALLPQSEQAGAAVPRASSLGMTETLGPHTFAGPGDLPEGDQDSFGRSVPGVEHRIVDPVTLEELPAGCDGEVWVRGYSVMLDLHKRERPEVFTADGWYRTGDSGHFDGVGHLHFTGRLGDLIKSSGMNVTPLDVEVVLEDLPEVSMAFVTGVDHPDRGQVVVAAVALRPGDQLDEDEVRSRASERLASYQVPRHVAVYADQRDLPWLDSGKLDRRALAARLAARFGAG
ncbi:class I adenylate-forming enzyme family protein [Dermatobacter hominis]|uniref:class I adenylate-forming enzyme family protein n=1 Tax=Dermatobacter hominis TaxID=2884263 RepID=UPI001D120859|nr:class I adenylate-forming enzyme family protein [Dermatobacter hominis]UDY35037.1 acyl--CoA ligase [Dermatobacter hominis]